MRQIRPLGIVLAAIAIVAGSYAVSSLTSAPPQRITPVVREAEGFGLPAGVADNAVPEDLAEIDDEIKVWGAKSAADARDDISAGNLAVLYLGRGRLTGDAADYERSLAAANRAVAAYPTSTGTRALKATVLQATHDFAGALALATQVTADDPQNVDALSVVGDAELELGRLDDATRTYTTVAAIQTGPALDARLARLAWLKGDATRALTLARAARDGAAESTTSDPSFYDAQLGEIARLVGNATVARSAFDAALATRPTNQLALLGKARLDAFAGNTSAAILGLQTAAAIAPRPETLALLSDLLDRSGDAAAARRAADTIQVIDQLGGTSAQLFDRQILGFDLDHGLATASQLDRAVAAAAVRPDAAGLDTVAWAAFRVGDLTTARAESDKALGSGSIDARILYHAGAIAIASGDLAGRTLVERALDLGPALDPFDRAAARTLLAAGG